MSYHAKITSKGQITLPAELRARLGLDEGDTVEFYLDGLGRVSMRPRRPGVDEVLNVLPSRRPIAKYATDDDAVAAAVLARDARTRRKKRQPRK